VESVATASTDEAPRLETGIGELDRVLGGGVVAGASVLLGGEPGIGKSTLMLQTAAALASRRVLYVSGEESARQIRLRAERLGATADIDLLCDGDTASITRALDDRSPELIVIDSVQALHSAEAGPYPGTVNQIKYSTYEILDWVRAHEGRGHRRTEGDRAHGGHGAVLRARRGTPAGAALDEEPLRLDRRDRPVRHGGRRAAGSHRPRLGLPGEA
jgi:hypothetical protein